jgi:hypothetical protein
LAASSRVVFGLSDCPPLLGVGGSLPPVQHLSIKNATFCRRASQPRQERSSPPIFQNKMHGKNEFLSCIYCESSTSIYRSLRGTPRPCLVIILPTSKQWQAHPNHLRRQFLINLAPRLTKCFGSLILLSVFPNNAQSQHVQRQSQHE